MEITQEIVDQFRAVYPEYANVTTWPDSVVNKALCEGDAETGSQRWGGYEDDCHNFKQRGMFYYAAHVLATRYPRGAEDQTDVQISTPLNVAAKSVGDENVTYRVGEMQNSGDDWLSTTQYGINYLRLRRRAGMGAVAV